MKTAIAVLLAFAAAVAAQGGATINTPSGANLPTQCENFQITWTGGTQPFDIRLLNADQSPNEIISQNATGNSLTWLCNVASGPNYIFTIRDSTGTLNPSGMFTVSTNSDSSCLNGGASASGAAPSSSGAPSASAPAGSTAPAGSSTSAASGSSTPRSSASGSASASGSSPSPSNSTSAGKVNVASAGALGALFAAAAALF